MIKAAFRPELPTLQAKLQVLTCPFILSFIYIMHLSKCIALVIINIYCTLR